MLPHKFHCRIIRASTPRKNESMKYNISIIIPVYNVEDYIQECLESVMSQTMSEGVECILVDDCGNDNSIRIASSIIDDYKGPIEFRIIHHEHNKGISRARNTGIKEAKGEYLYYLDSDDYLIPDCLEQMWKMVEKYPGVNLVCGGAINNQDNPYNIFDRRIKEYVKDRGWIVKNSLGSILFPVAPWNKLYRKDLILKNELFFKEGIIYEDYNYLIKLPYYINDIAFCKKNTYYYRCNPKSIMQTLNEDQQRPEHARIVNLNDLISELKPDAAFYNRLHLICLIIYELKTIHQHAKPEEKIKVPCNDLIKKCADIFEHVLIHNSKSTKGLLYRVLYYINAYRLKMRLMLHDTL